RRLLKLTLIRVDIVSPSRELTEPGQQTNVKYGDVVAFTDFKTQDICLSFAAKLYCASFVHPQSHTLFYLT
ncbi:hypothetical protein STEG23_038194, partial [Scotinomys teguina]